MTLRQERLLLERIHQTNRLHGLFREGDAVFLALSGGPDSAALAGLFSALSKSRALRLRALHLNHGLSRQSARFEAAARRTAERFGIPFRSAAVDVRALARRARLSVEEAGRSARYDFFVRQARRSGASVATAHTRDDQVETVLFRIFRGTSVRGLAGIPYRRTERGVSVIRPLLDCDKKELLAYAHSRKLPYVFDRSNRSPRHTRNRIRHELLPLLEKRFNPRVREAVAGLQQSCREMASAIGRAADRGWTACRPRRVKGGVSLERAAFARLEPGLRQELFLRAAEAAGAGRRSLGRVHARAVHALARGTAASAGFPGFTVTAGRERIIWRRKHAR